MARSAAAKPGALTLVTSSGLVPRRDRMAAGAPRNQGPPPPFADRSPSRTAFVRRQTVHMKAARPRRADVRAFPSSRHLVTAALRAGRRKAPMQGLIDLDVTEANRILANHDPPATLTAFIVASVARAAAAHPDVHAYRNWRGQLV